MDTFPEYLDPKRPYSCWLIADNTLPFGQEATSTNRFALKCLLKHTLLFNVYRQQLVIADSHAVNNASLRLLLRHDKDTQRLFESQMIAVAVRQGSNGRETTVPDLREDFIANDKYLFGKLGYGEGDELELYNNCPAVAYSLDDISKRYEEKVLEILRGDAARQLLPRQLAKQIERLAMEERARLHTQGEGKRLGRIFFFEQLRERLSQSVWNKHGAAIDTCAAGPFHSGLPTILKADPVYASDHASAFEVMRGVRQKSRLEQTELSFEGVLGLAEYQLGIASLEVDDIYYLLETDEAREYAKARDEMSTSIQALRQALIALKNYSEQIEERILIRRGDLKPSKNHDRKQILKANFDQFVDITERTWDFFGIFSTWMSALKFTLGHTIYDRYNQERRRQELKLLKEADAERRLMSQSLERQWRDSAEPTIQSTIAKKSVIDPAHEAEARERVDLDEIETFYKD